jgi:hypothetical protein
VKALRRALDIIAERAQPKPGTTLQHAGRCGRCGKTLTVPESKATGLGPDCAAALQVQQQKPAAGTNESAQVRQAVASATAPRTSLDARRSAQRPPATPDQRQVRCERCAGTGLFVTRLENGKPTGPGGICYRCGGKGWQDSSDERRNWGYDRFYMRATA